jgi:hypothetical protein
MNTWEAEENICHNLDLLHEACEAYDDDYASVLLPQGAEVMDIFVRQYMVEQVLEEAIDNCKDELEEYYDKENAKEDIELD